MAKAKKTKRPPDAHERTWGTPGMIAGITAAACVIAWSGPTRAWLAQHDPRALEQLDDALRAFRLEVPELFRTDLPTPRLASTTRGTRSRVSAALRTLTKGGGQ